MVHASEPKDTTTGKQTSLRTKDKTDALRLLHVKNEAVHPNDPRTKYGSYFAADVKPA
jgi:hypothetical protein